MRAPALLIAACTALALPSAAGLVELDSLQALMLAPNNVSLRDLALLPHNAKPDPFRLSRVEALLREPFTLEAATAEILSRTAPADERLPLHPDSLWPLLDAPTAPADTARSAAFDPAAALAEIRAGLKEHVSALDASETEFLRVQAPGLFLQEEEDTTRTPIENELRRQEDDARARHIMGLGARLRREGLSRASAAAWRLQAWIIGEARAGRAREAAALLKRKAGRDFPVTLGTPGADRMTVGHGIWIDPGGDDQYAFQGPARAGAFTLVVDVSGSDLWLGRDSLHQGAGNLGISLLADLGGDDRWLGSNFAWGSALFGYASVFDAAGHDTWDGRCASLGFGFFGIGILEEGSGNDLYAASLLSQGASSTRGFGGLVDRHGDDRYLARPTFKDDLRYSDHYIQMVQGFSTGFSPDFGGGVALLRDRSGNDAYMADIFGQGSGYWYALGMLIDEAGDDRYEAHQYAQGAGVHIAIGAALDFGGNDHRASKGVSQGCGHDYGLGYLYDRSGEDNYLATDMSQGAGSANGLGILQDGGYGADFYATLNPEMALGHADLRRDRGSFGFFLDRGGKDKYSRPRSEGSAWRVSNGKNKGNGFGLDR